MSDKTWVTASQIAQADYCPYQLYLQHGGEPVDERTTRAFAQGSHAHAVFNRSLPAPGRRLSPVIWVAIAVSALIALIALIVLVVLP